MKHKSFKTSKNKLFELYNQTEENSNQIIEKESFKKNIITNINQSNLKDFVINTSLNIDTNFETPEYITIDIEDEGEVLAIIKKSWDIDLGIIPFNLIPYIKTNIILKNGDTELPLTDDWQISSSNLFVNSFIDIEDIVGNEEIKKARVLTSILITTNPELLEFHERLPFYTVKLNTFLQNPNEYL